MSLIADIFTAKKHLPVLVTHDAMELLEVALGAKKFNDALFVEIGDTIEETPDNLKELLQEHFPGILESALEEECEFIHFFI